MSAKAISEYDGKHLLAYWLSKQGITNQMARMCRIDFGSLASDDKQCIDIILDQALEKNPWLSCTKLVCKPDMLIKRRGKNGLLGINLDWPAVKTWIAERAAKTIKVMASSCRLITLVEF